MTPDPDAQPAETSAVSDTNRRVPPGLVLASEWVWRSALVFGGVLALAWLFLFLRLVTVPAIVALLVTSVLQPLARGLRRRGWSALLATWATLAAFTVVIVGAGAVLIPMVADETENLDEQLSGGIAEVEDWLETGPLGLEDVDLREIGSDIADHLAASERLVDGVTLAGEIMAGLLLAVVMTFFFIKDGPDLVVWARSLLPDRHHERARRAGRAAWAALSAYVRGTAIVGLVNGTVIGLGLFVIGVPLVLPLAVLTAVSAFFPLVGAVAAGAVATLIALFAGGVTDALLVLGLVVVVQQIEGDVLSPVVLGRALRLHPLVILVALTVGAICAGILGAFLAVPFTGVAVAAYEAGSRSPDVRQQPTS